jgi:hypothetical protein
MLMYMDWIDIHMEHEASCIWAKKFWNLRPLAIGGHGLNFYE